MCKGCGEAWPIEEFPRNSAGTIRGRCFPCYNLYQREYRRRNAERPLEADEVGYGFTKLPPVTPAERSLFEKEYACKGDDRFTLEGRSYMGGSRSDTHLARELRALCNACPAKRECHETVENFEVGIGAGGTNVAYLSGFWAGETPSDRVHRRKQEQLADAA